MTSLNAHQTAALKSFRANLSAGESRQSAWIGVETELHELMAEYFDADLPTNELDCALEWWVNIDYRAVDVSPVAARFERMDGDFAVYSGVAL